MARTDLQKDIADIAKVFQRLSHEIIIDAINHVPHPAAYNTPFADQLEMVCNATLRRAKMGQAGSEVAVVVLSLMNENETLRENRLQRADIARNQVKREDNVDLAAYLRGDRVVTLGCRLNIMAELKVLMEAADEEVRHNRRYKWRDELLTEMANLEALLNKLDEPQVEEKEKPVFSSTGVSSMEE